MSGSLGDMSIGVGNVRGATCQSDLCYAGNRTSKSVGMTSSVHKLQCNQDHLGWQCESAGERVGLHNAQDKCLSGESQFEQWEGKSPSNFDGAMRHTDCLVPPALVSQGSVLLILVLLAWLCANRVVVVVMKHWVRCLSTCSTRLNMGETILGKVISKSFAGVCNIDFPNEYPICVYQWCVELGADSASLVSDVSAMLCRIWTCSVRYVWGGIRRIWGYIRIRVHYLRGKCGYREEGSKSCTPKILASPGRFSGQHRRWNFVKSVIWMSILYPIGEACNPGPSNGQANNWEFGIFNPSGLSNKTNLVANMDGEIWGCSETHLTKHGVSQLKTGLKALKSPYKFVLAGHPAETKTTADVGTYTGVLLLSKHPARALMHDVPKDLYDTGRLQFSGVYVQGLWVQIGTVYGFPIGSNHVHHRYQTDLLLEAVIDRIGLQTTGPRIICGDLNHNPQDLSQVNKLRSLGFAEAQELALFRWGQIEQATGKGTLKLDQIWLSIELQQA